MQYYGSLLKMNTVLENPVQYSLTLGDVKLSINELIGRYILSTKIFTEIKKLKPGQGGEIHITDAIRSLIKKENKFYGNIFTGKYLDCGTLSGYINSGIQISKGK